VQQVAGEVGFRAELITPQNPERRGSQLSLAAHGFGKSLFEALTEAGVITDWREPNVIRMAPVPLYNTFEDIASFLIILKDCTTALSTK
jgi:kynureninase